MKFKKRARTPVWRQFDLHSIVSRADAVRMIEKETRRFGEDERLVRNRITHRLSYAIQKGQLPNPGRNGFVFGKVFGWAQENWPGKFLGWPVYRRVSADLCLAYEAAEQRESALLALDDLAGWRALALRLETDNIELRRKDARLRRASAAGRKGGRPKKK